MISRASDFNEVYFLEWPWCVCVLEMDSERSQGITVPGRGVMEYFLNLEYCTQGKKGTSIRLGCRRPGFNFTFATHQLCILRCFSFNPQNSNCSYRFESNHCAMHLSCHDLVLHQLCFGLKQPFCRVCIWTYLSSTALCCLFKHRNLTNSFYVLCRFIACNCSPSVLDWF